MQIMLTFASSDDSGAGRMGYYFAREFRHRGLQVGAFLPQPFVEGNALLRDRLRGIGAVINEVPRIPGALDLKVINRLIAVAREGRTGLVVSMLQKDMKFAALAAMQLRVPYVASGQNTITFSGGWLRRYLSGLVLGGLLNRACPEVVATSERVAMDFRRLLRFKRTISMLPNGVDTASYARSEAAREEVRCELGLRNAITFITVGRISEQKNHVGLVEAFAMCQKSKPCHLLIVGDTALDGDLYATDVAYKHRVLKRVKDLGLMDHVSFVGWRKDVVRMLSVGDCYVQASLWEGSPLAVIEAMANGLPVIVANSGGILPGFCPGKHGWIVPAGDVPALGSAMQEVLGMGQEDRNRVGEGSRLLAIQEYDTGRIAAEFADRALAHVKSSATSGQ